MTFDSLPDLIALSALAGFVMPLVAAIPQKPRATTRNRVIRIVLAVGAALGATAQACPTFALECVVTSAAVVVAAAEASYAAWTQPLVDRLTAATSRGR